MRGEGLVKERHSEGKHREKAVIGKLILVAIDVYASLRASASDGDISWWLEKCDDDDARWERRA